ncbi:arginase [Cohnella sp.]|uniref:arginase n=1 Tax=Cohnella sp. TaxID=1883426 RepID=UPI0035655F45
MIKDKKVSVINVPFGLGANRPGTEQGPESLSQVGLKRHLDRLGLEVKNDYSVICPSKEYPAVSSGIRHLAEIKEMIGLVAERVSQSILEQTFPLVIGGDHSVTLGALAGISPHYTNLGVIWFDAHVNLHTKETNPTSSISRMTLAIALGKSKFELSDIPETDSFMKSKNTVLIGTRELDANEKELIQSEGITCFSMHDIDRMGIQQVIEKALQIAGNGTDGIHLSFDVDSLDPFEAPGVSTQVLGGLTYREAHFALELLAESERITSMDIVEINSLLDIERRTARLAVGLISSLLGKRII